jgi:ribosome-associated toxin RatA of RatAB toxin-antitoxin module
MPTFEHAVDVRATAASLFALTQDYDRRLAWDPFLREARLIGANEAGVGVRAWCVAQSGLGMETEYVSFDPPRVCAVKMTRGPAMLKSFSGSWRFSPGDAGTTRVVFRYNVETSPRILGAMMSWMFERETRKRLAALKQYVEGMS